MPETTQKYHRIPVKRKIKTNELRTITIDNGIKALYDIKRKIIVTYLFDKKKYTMKKAKEWLNKHKKSKASLLAEHNLILASEIAVRTEELKDTIVNLYMSGDKNEL